MPRSSRFNGYAAAEEEEEVICPYNKQHRIRVSQIQQHLAVCRKGLQGRNGSDTRVCPYNSNHHVSVTKFAEHVANCPDASFEDNGFERERYNRGLPRRQTNGRDKFDFSPERYESDSRVRPSQMKQPSFDGRHTEQHTAPKGFKIGKGFGSTKEYDSGNFVRDRSFRHSREENGDRYDESASYGSRNKKSYIRSKSNLDEESIRQAQRNAVAQVREFQQIFDQKAPPRLDDAEGFSRLNERESDRFTKLREPSALKPQPHRESSYDEPPVERMGYGRGRPVVENYDTPRPGGGWNLPKSEYRELEPEYKDELLSSNASAASSRFRIMKASSVFGPVEVAAPVPYVGAAGKGFSSSTTEEEDWGGGGAVNGGGIQRTFTIQRASDVFRLDPDRDFRRRDDGSHLRGEYGGRADFHPNRQFEIKHPDEVFSNRQPLAPRFARPRTPSEVREQKKPELPWPFNRFAENPNLGKRNEGETRNSEIVRMEENGVLVSMDSGVSRKSPVEQHGPSETRYLTSPNEGISVDEEMKSYDCSECEIMSNTETLSSGGGRIYKRADTDSPPSWQSTDRPSSETSELTAGAVASSAKPKVLSIYDQYAQFDLEDDDFGFVKPAEPIEPILPDPTMGAIFAHLRRVGITQSPGFGSSHSSSPYSSLMQ